AGTKRASDVEPAGRTTRGSKAAKTDTDVPPKATKGPKGKRGGAKASLSATQFKSHALPLHVYLTHTAPAAEAEAPADPGSLGTCTLAPASFSTGSYGWKGTKRVTIEVVNPENPSGEKEKVQVMVTINATVLGSKSAPGDEAAEAHSSELKEGEHEHEHEHEEADANGDDAGAEHDENKDVAV
ncbi:hypothetical protein FISHEDRAFT_43767, partial [Fistulina hepatica ATCC 64428]